MGIGHKSTTILISLSLMISVGAAATEAQHSDFISDKLTEISEKFQEEIQQLTESLDSFIRSNLPSDLPDASLEVNIEDE